MSIVDSHNRWITIHGTHYLLVRDCVGYKSVGHGYFLEDGTEVYNLLDRNLAVQAYQGPRLPLQALPFDPNEGAGFWWANGLNTFTRNVTTENDEYGYRYDMQKRRDFDTNLSIRQPKCQKLTFTCSQAGRGTSFSSSSAAFSHSLVSLGILVSTASSSALRTRNWAASA